MNDLLHRDAVAQEPGVDTVTGFGGLAALRTTAEAVVTRSEPAGCSVSVAVVELPNLDADCARSMSLALRASVRDGDHCFRIDDARLVVLLPMASSRTVARVMERTACLTDRDFAYGVAATGTDVRLIDPVVARASGRLTHFTASSLR